MPTPEELVAELDANPVPVGQRCYSCTRTTEDQRRFILLAHEHRHSPQTISDALARAYDLIIGAQAIRNHLRNHAAR